MCRDQNHRQSENARDCGPRFDRRRLDNVRQRVPQYAVVMRVGHVRERRSNFGLRASIELRGDRLPQLRQIRAPILRVGRDGSRNQFEQRIRNARCAETARIDQPIHRLRGLKR